MGQTFQVLQIKCARRFKSRSEQLWLPYSFVKSHTPLMFCAGGMGGVAQGLPVKSKNSVMSGMAASRAVSVGRPQRASMNRR